MATYTVLLADDEQVTRESYRAYLEEIGFTVHEASNGGEAIRLVRERQPDIVIMDVVMPVVDGAEAAASLRAYPDTAGIPIIGVTAGTSWQECERMRTVCDELILKPCPPAVIADAVRRWVAQAGAQGKPRLEAFS